MIRGSEGLRSLILRLKYSRRCHAPVLETELTQSPWYVFWSDQGLTNVR
jgi:hypothetical protein